jgi:hypothetical protein
MPCRGKHIIYEAHPARDGTHAVRPAQLFDMLLVTPSDRQSGRQSRLRDEERPAGYNDQRIAGINNLPNLTDRIAKKPG